MNSLKAFCSESCFNILGIEYLYIFKIREHSPCDPLVPRIFNCLMGKFLVVQIGLYSLCLKIELDATVYIKSIIHAVTADGFFHPHFVCIYLPSKGGKQWLNKVLFGIRFRILFND